MKPAIVLSLVLAMTWASGAVAQRDDKISLWADDEGVYCALVATPAIHSVHMFHTGSLPATASRFSAPKPDCWRNATWVGDHIASPYLSIGNSQSDLSIAYMGYTTGCTPTPIYLGTIDYLVAGGTPPCCRYEASPAESMPSILVVDCYFEEFEASMGTGIVINPTPDCPCSVGPPPPPPPPPPVDPGIALFADTEMSTCILQATGAGFHSVYMFHLGTPTTTASQFAAPLPACWTGTTWLADRIEAPFLSLGNSQNDLSVAYAGCQEPPVYIGRIDFYSNGAATPCCEYAIVPASGQAGILTADCDYEAHVIAAGPSVIINPEGGCGCNGSTVSVQETTWGKIKAMYR